MTNGKYKWVSGRPPEKVEDLLVWGNWMQRNNCSVALDNIVDIVISTMFLGLDYSFSVVERKAPLLFETMVVYGKEIEHCKCYETENEARNGHWNIFLKIRDEMRKES